MMISKDVKKRNDNLFYILIIFIQCLMFIFLFPNLESPDILYHIEKVFQDTISNNEFYIKLLTYYKGFINNIIPNELELNYTLTGIRKYFSMESIVEYPNGNYFSVMLLQSFNIILIFSSIGIFNFIVNKDRKLCHKEKRYIKKINYFYFLFPQTAYFITTITPDFFNFLIQPYFMLFIYTRRHKLNLFILFIMYIYCDEGIITNILFLVVYLFCHYVFKINKSNNKYNYILYIPILSIILYIFSRKYLTYFSSESIFINIAIDSIENHGNIVTKVVNLFMSSFCFWGIGNYITFPILYLIYIIVVITIVYRSVKGKTSLDNRYFELIFTFIICCIFVLIFYGTHSNIRFLMFWIPIFILGYQIYIDKNKEYNEKSYVLKASLLFFHNVFLILFYSIKIFILN